MAKPLFKNYNFQFDKNEKKILINFCKSIIKQMAADEKFSVEIKTYNAIIDKLNEPSDEVKFTKDEKTKLVLHLKENIKHMEAMLKKSGFLKRWLYKSALTQYRSLMENKFNN